MNADNVRLGDTILTAVNMRPFNVTDITKLETVEAHSQRNHRIIRKFRRDRLEEVEHGLWQEMKK